MPNFSYAPVVGIIANSSQHKRSSSGQSLSMERHHDSGIFSTVFYLEDEPILIV